MRPRGLPLGALQNHGQRHRAELLAAERVSRALGDVEHKLVRLNLDSIDPPLALGKDDIVRLGAELAVDYAQTVSCYRATDARGTGLRSLRLFPSTVPIWGYFFPRRAC